MQNLISAISRRTQEMDAAERAGDMREYDRLLKDRGAKILEALERGATEDYLREITK